MTNSALTGKEVASFSFSNNSWNDSERAGRPVGGEAQALRAAFAMLKARYA